MLLVEDDARDAPNSSPGISAREDYEVKQTPDGEEALLLATGERRPTSSCSTG